MTKQPSHIGSIISRTAHLAPVTGIEIEGGSAWFTFDTRIIAGDYWKIGLQNAAPIEILEQAARNILHNELLVFLPAEQEKEEQEV